MAVSLVKFGRSLSPKYEDGNPLLRQLTTLMEDTMPYQFSGGFTECSNPHRIYILTFLHFMCTNLSLAK